MIHEFARFARSDWMRLSGVDQSERINSSHSIIIVIVIKIIILGTTDRLHWDYNPLGWLKAKAVDDDCENLWRVHNGLYDLSQWVNKHPGG